MPRFDELISHTQLTGTPLERIDWPPYVEAVDRIHENQNDNYDAFLMEVTRDADGHLAAVKKWSEYYRIGMHYAQAYLLNGTYVVVESLFKPEPEARKKAAATWATHYQDIVGGPEQLESWLDRLPPSNFDETPEIVGIWTYSSEDEARADTRRLALTWATEAGNNLFAYAGWGADAVLFVRADVDWYVIRTFGDGTIKILGHEDSLQGSAQYGEQVGKLADEIDNDPRKFGIHEMGNPMVGRIVEAWLRREAAEVMLDVARQALRHRMEGLDRITELAQQHGEEQYALNFSELARKLYTDRPNLYRLMPTRKQPTRRRR